MPMDASVAPKERINITYESAVGDQQAQVELPLKMLVMGDFKGGPGEGTLEERDPININGACFDAVMQDLAPELNLTVKDTLSGKKDAELGLSLKFNSLKDFHPDNVSRNIPALGALMELRDALRALKGPLGNLPQFRRHLAETVKDEAARKALLTELKLSDKDSKK